MQASQIYILISIVVLLIISFIIFFIRKNRKQKPRTPLTGLAFGFIIAGIIFGDNRLRGYSLIGIGILLTVIDIIIKLKSKN